MRLLSIESAEENEAVRQALSESFFEASSNSDQHHIAFAEAFLVENPLHLWDVKFWLSGTNYGVQLGDYYWDSTGEYLGVFADWMAGEPKVDLFPGCSLMSPDWNDTFRWSTWSCHNECRFICESAPVTTNLEANAKKAPSRFKIDDKVYEISTDRVSYLTHQPY